MRTKNAKPMTDAERAHVAAVKSCACSVCDAPPPSAAHHIEQGDHFTTVALCDDCHQGAFNGWHGQRRIWSVMKMTELSALSVTVRRVVEMVKGGRV